MPGASRIVSAGRQRMRQSVYRFSAAGLPLAVFFGMSWLYEYGNRDLYVAILQSLGVVPYRFPFVDTSGSLAAWECARQGVDVILTDPCDVLHRGYNYSPLWMTASAIPLGVRDTMAVGWSLDLVFLLSLSLLPPPGRLMELALVSAATLSTMVVFALERANPDLLIFLLALAAGLLAEYRLVLRLFGYSLGLIAALIKYYPIMLLLVIFREGVSIFWLLVLMILGSLAVFWVEYHVEIARGLPHIARGRYDTDLFGAQNLPSLMGMLAEHLAEPSPFAAAAACTVKVGLYVAMVGACLARCRGLLRFAELRAALASLPDRDRVLLVIGCAVIAGCYFAGQSIGYRGVFLLLVIPGLLSIARGSARKLRVLAFGNAIIIVFLMWGECFRLALYRAIEQTIIPPGLAGSVQMVFWLCRELCWWWVVAFMLAVLADFLLASPIGRRSRARSQTSWIGGRRTASP